MASTAMRGKPASSHSRWNRSRTFLGLSGRPWWWSTQPRSLRALRARSLMAIQLRLLWVLGTVRVARRAEFLVVHLLPAHRRDLAELFGGETGEHTDKFARTEWTEGPGGVPVLTGALAWFAAQIEEHADWGDHVGFKLAPVDGQVRSVGPPLLLRQVGGVEAGHPA
ncbi:hypothetical protein ABH930_002761 [Kitasatospora sp. GAS204A]|nr:hypothetical protein [Kitasatospora sp. GAS204B]